MAGRKFEDLAVRYERHIDRTPTCWIWRSNKNQRGYGQFRIGRDSGTKLVHRWAYEHFVGPIPEGMLVLHKCDNPSCSNPEHLYLGDSKQNSKDRLERHPNAYGYKRPFMNRVRKLTDDKIRSIKHHLQMNMFDMQSIANYYGISYAHVQAIKYGTRKAHITHTCKNCTPAIR